MMAAALAAAVAVVMVREPGTQLSAQSRVSKPGEYAGYSSKAYDGHQRTSFYVAVRDGTRLAVDLFRPTQQGRVATEKLPVVWMHTPYNRRTYRGGAGGGDLSRLRAAARRVRLRRRGGRLPRPLRVVRPEPRLQPRRVARCRAHGRVRHHRVVRRSSRGATAGSACGAARRPAAARCRRRRPRRRRSRRSSR